MNRSEGLGQARRTDVGDVEIRPMNTQDMDAVCEVIGLAFAENPRTLANVRGDVERSRRTTREAVRIAKFGQRGATL